MHVKKKLTYGGDSSNNFSQFKFVQDCCFTSCIKTHSRTEEEEKNVKLIWTRLNSEGRGDRFCCWRLEQGRRQEVSKDKYHTKASGPCVTETNNLHHKILWRKCVALKIIHGRITAQFISWITLQCRVFQAAKFLRHGASGTRISAAWDFLGCRVLITWSFSWKFNSWNR